jgi:acetyl esterase/lipase
MQDWDPAWDIDAETAAFIARTEAAYPAEPPAGSSPGVAAERAAYDAMCRAFRAPRPPDLAVEEIDGPVPMRRYRPAAPEGAQVLYLHGGGFVLGGLDSHDDVCAEIAATANVRLTAAAYRLAPEYRHPAQLQDAAEAYAAVAAAGPTLLVGDSAGATLAAGLALGPARGAAGLVLIYPALGGDALGLPSYRSRAEAPMLTARGMAAYARHRGAALGLAGQHLAQELRSRAWRAAASTGAPRRPGGGSAEEVSPPPPTPPTWTFKIRARPQGVEFHNGQTVTAEDVTATLRRHSDENRKSGALGIMQAASNRPDGDTVVITSPRQRRPALPAGRLPPDHPAQWRQGQPRRGHLHRPLQGGRTSPACATAERFANHWNQTVRPLPTRSRSSSSTTPPRALGAAVGPGAHHQPRRAEDRPTCWRVPGVTIKQRLGPRALRVHHALQHRALRQQRPAHGAEIRDQPRGDGRQDPAGYGSVGNDIPINAAYPLFDESIPQRAYDPDQAADFYKKLRP